MIPHEESSYLEGRRLAWVNMLHLCLEHLQITDPVRSQCQWIIERQEAITVLRSLCAEYGDLDWPDDLALADILAKHLGRYLSEE